MPRPRWRGWAQNENLILTINKQNEKGENEGDNKDEDGAEEEGEDQGL